VALAETQPLTGDTASPLLVVGVVVWADKPYEETGFVSVDDGVLLRALGDTGGVEEVVARNAGETGVDGA
jgi:hypothetical protein